jgi:hypothetical protein
MKRALLFAMLCLPALAFSQNNLWGPVDSSGGSVSMTDHSFAGTANDTIIIKDLYAANYKTLYFNLFAKDSVTMLIDYALSMNGTDFSNYATKDSISHGTSGNGIKSVDFTSTVLGAAYLRIRLRTSANAFALGTTTPTFTPYYTFKRY